MKPERLARSAAAVPGRFWAAAVIWMILVLATAFPNLPGMYMPFIQDRGAAQVFDSALTLMTLAMVLAPVVALIRPLLGLGLAMGPLVLTAAALPLAAMTLPDDYSGTVLLPIRIAVYLAMLSVAYVAFWRSARVGWLLGGAALLVPALFAFWDRTVLIYLGYTGQVSSMGWAAGRRWQSFGLYVLATALTLGTAVALRLSATRKRDRREVEVERAEVDARASLARDLHDVVAHRISLVAVRAETAPYTNPDLSPEARTILADIAGDARAAMDEMRGVLGVLHRSQGAALLAPQPVAADVTDLVREAREAGADVRLEGALPELDPIVGNTVYRVVQEALTNARRHAPGATATVRLSDTAEAVRVVVDNPARDTDGEPGRGLTGMRERVELTGGTLHTGVRDGRFVVDAELPRAAHD